MSEASDNVFVGDLPLESTMEGIQAVFSAYGTVVQTRVLPPKGQKASALVRFGSVEEATWVVQNLNGNLAEGLTEPVVVRFANAPGSHPAAQMGQPNGFQQQQPQMGGKMQGYQAQKPQVAPPSPSDNLFVGDLPADITTEQVQMIFSAYGSVVQCRAIPPKGPGFKSSALIRFSSVDEASWVVANLNGNLAEGLQEPCIVRFANAPGAGAAAAAAPAAQHGGFQLGAAPAVPPPSDNLFVGDLPADITTEQVQNIFSAYGSVVQCRAMPPKMPGGKSSALIRFGSVDEATWVVNNLNGNLAEGLQEPCVVRFSNPPGQKGAAGQGFQGSYGAAQNFGQGKGGFRNEPYNGGLKFPKKPGVPDSFRSYFTAIRKAGILGEARVSEDGQVYINNLPADTTDHDIYKLFSAFGPIMANGARAMLNPDGTCKGFGFVDFLDPSHAQAAIAAISEFTLPDGSSIAPSIKVSKTADPNAQADYAATGFQATTYGGV